MLRAIRKSDRVDVQVLRLGYNAVLDWVISLYLNASIADGARHGAEFVFRLFVSWYKNNNKRKCATKQTANKQILTHDGRRRQSKGQAYAGANIGVCCELYNARSKMRVCC